MSSAVIYRLQAIGTWLIFRIYSALWSGFSGSYREDFYREALARHQQRATTSSPVQLQWKNCAGFSKITAITS